jgi:hypothetical protein
MLDFGTLILSPWPDIESQVLLVLNTAPVLKKRDNTGDQKGGGDLG